MGNAGSTALHKAANDKDLARLRWEVQQHPSEVNVQEREHGWTALHVAAARGSDPIVRELLARGARHDILDKDGRTALHLAAQSGYVEVVRDLLRRGASPAVRDKSGAAPYDLAVQRHPTVAALLGPPPPPPPAASPAAAAPPPLPLQYGGMPPVDVASAASASHLLPAAPAPGPPHIHSQPPAAPPNPADLDWGPAAPTDWGGEPDVPGPSPPRRPGFNPIMSARFQLEKLLGAGLSQLGLVGPAAGPGSSAGGGGAARADPRVGGGSGGGGGASGASAASGLTAASSGALSSPGGRLYSYRQLYDATGGFSAVNKLGEGGYGPVYRGSLDGIPVAVKVMDCSEGALQGRAEFEAEVAILSSLHHPHVVLLIGSCPEKVVAGGGRGAGRGPGAGHCEELDLIRVSPLCPPRPAIAMHASYCVRQGMLVYELMTNSSLEVHLFGNGYGREAAAGAAPPVTAGGRPPLPLPWRDRVRIAAEVASALLFLHSAPTPIVHMDLKPANILLDEHLTAKLGDVGLARLAPALAQPAGPAGAAAAAPGGPRSTVKDSRLVGTFEYMDPEYLRSGEYSARSDVYALGMVLLQLLTGRGGAQVVATVETARKQPLGFAPIIDPRAGPWPAAEAVAFADLALRCVEYRRQDRPDLRTVVLPTLAQLKQRTMLYEPQPAPAPSQPPPGATDGDVMDEPVVAADGYTYERLAIQEWVSRSSTSPLTNMPLPHSHLVENRTLRSAIVEWREQQQGQQQGTSAGGGQQGQAGAAAAAARPAYDNSAGW
ncbi:hypothetical protein GPECTOR_13g766 [Gonium pectorale]|uniref:Uncharacterized protein n=1 Tax=Gonium pectorale TaxID=33097 RepID=A0A150GN81_GONPE|nr:hypothetical protein GPECTOR_13g766 [Gonium pectorale]|eukprot:KXZ51279.1 hypothetical protein GPECTOR_13g766 [Gonium pectorale]